MDRERRTVAVGLGVNKTTILFGKLPVRFGAVVHYSAIQPDDATQTWLFRFYMVPVVPSRAQQRRLGKAQRAQHVISLECPQAVFQYRIRGFKNTARSCNTIIINWQTFPMARHLSIEFLWALSMRK